MFRLATPIIDARPISDFDDISTILTNSSLTGSQKAAPWQQHVGEDGHVFYVELTEPKPSRISSTTLTTTDTGTCALCSTRSCRSCASEDTGYSSDTDTLPPSARAQKSVLDVSQDSLFHSKHLDADTIPTFSKSPKSVLDLSQDSLFHSKHFDIETFPSSSKVQKSTQNTRHDSISHSKHFHTDATPSSLKPPKSAQDLSHDSIFHSNHSAIDSLHSSSRYQNSVLDLSHDSLFPSKHVDFDDKDDGVSVDLADFDPLHTNFAQVFDDEDDLIGDVLHRHGFNKSRTKCCARASSLCERHSNKLNVPHTYFSKSDKACKCGGHSGSMVSPRTSTQNPSLEVVLHLRVTESPRESSNFDVGWLQSVLGIVPGFESQQGGMKDGGVLDNDKIVIKSLTVDGPAAKSKKLSAGDCIETINGKRVGWSNLKTVLSSIHQTKKIRLSVCRPTNHHHDSPLSDRLLLDPVSILQTLQHHHDGPSPPPSSREWLQGVCVLYMSMEGSGREEEGEEVRGGSDVVYQFPKEDGILPRLRGCFYTLEHLLSADSCDSSDVRTLTVGVDGCMVNVACHKEGKDMLIVTAPHSRLKSSQLLTLSNGLLRLVRLLYGSVGEAFSSDENHSSLDDFLTFTFSTLNHCFMGDNSLQQCPLFGYMDCLPLLNDIAVSVSNILTEYESSDFADMSDSFYGCRRSFTVLGSMAFYKGKVTSSHVTAKDGMDIWLYLRHSGLLDLSTRYSLQQVLVWREVYPSRLCHDLSTLNNVFGYSEPHARWFLMVVGVKNTLLACLLEAGGCSTQLSGVCLPDPFYVDQARAALLQLHTSDIVSACEIRLNGDGLPATASPDRFLSPHNPAQDLNPRGWDSALKASTSHGGHHNTPMTSNGVWAPGPSASGVGHGHGARGWLRQHRRSSLDSEGSSASGSSNETAYKNPTRRGRMFAVQPTTGVSPKSACVLDSDVNTYKLSSGKDNSLLFFCQVNEQEGVVVTSPMHNMATLSSSNLHKDIMTNFSRCVTQIHSDFASTTNGKIYPSEGVLEGVQGDQSWSRCREEGVMFTCTLPDKEGSKKSSHQQQAVYWVVGRRFKNPSCREVYVCFQDSTPQHIIELAFRLSLGTLAST